MSTISKKEKIYCIDLYDEMKNDNKDFFKIGEDFLNSKLKIKLEDPPPSKDNTNKQLYTLNKNCFDLDFNLNEIDILKDEFNLNKQDKSELIEKEEKESINNDITFERDLSKDASRDKITEEEKEKLEEEKRLFEMFGEEQYPSDDEIKSEPNITAIEVSDIELEEEEEIEENEENDINQEKKPQSENPFQFTEHILNQVKSPVDMLTIAEKVYELINKKEDTKEEIDLTPLNTYKKNNDEIKVQLFKSINMNGQYNQFKQNGNIKLEDYKSSEQKDEVPTAIIIDNRDYKTNCSIWFGTNKSKLIRIPICSKPSKECQGMVIDSQEAGITCMDIFEDFQN